MNWRNSINENRAIWVFVIIVAIVFIMAAVGYFSGAWDQPAVPVQ